MAKKITTYNVTEAKGLALLHIEKKHFGGTSPSDHSFNWTWGEIADKETSNVYGIWLRFALQVFCVSFAEDLDLYPVIEHGGDKIVCYKHFADLTEDEKKDLRACNFLKRAIS